MSLNFPRINLAINRTIDYYEIYRIKDEFELISGKGYGGANSKTVQGSYDLVFDLHKGMEDEIIQTIQNCYPATQILLFDFLKSWIEDYRIKETNTAHVYYNIDYYNNSLYQKFLKEVEEKESSFKSSFYYGLEHEAKYQIEKDVFSGLLPTGRKSSVAKKNNKFFCLDSTPEYIDLEYFEAYIIRLNKMVSNFRSILKTYVGLYNDGKLPAMNTITLGVYKEEPRIKELPQPLTTISKKINTTLTVPQIGFLFKMLHDAGIIKSETFKDIQEFISNNFIAGSKGEKEDISSGKLKRIWSDFDLEVSNFWDEKFVDLHNLAKKYNPNSIKTKR